MGGAVPRGTFLPWRKTSSNAQEGSSPPSLPCSRRQQKRCMWQGRIVLNKTETETGVPRNSSCSIQTIVRHVFAEMLEGQAPVERNTDLTLAAFDHILRAAAALGYHESFMAGAIKTVDTYGSKEGKDYRVKKVAGRRASFGPTLIESTAVSAEVKLAAGLGLARITLRSPELPCDVRDNVVCARRSRATCRFGRGSGDRSDQHVALANSECSDFAARSPLQRPFAAPLRTSPSQLASANRGPALPCVWRRYPREPRHGDRPAVARCAAR